MNFERTALLELYREHANICRDRNVQLRPVSIQLFDSSTLWGQFNSITRSLFISRKLICEQTWQNVLGVFKHEMAHQYVYEKNQVEFLEKPHGKLFQEACLILGVPPQYAKASMGLQDSSLSWKDDDIASPEKRILDKVKKLLALGASSNEFEASLAMKKVQALYAEYNLTQVQLSDPAKFVHQVISSEKKRQSPWQQRIMSLLIEFFFVEIIIIQQFNPKTSERNQAFEIIGTRENVLMAEYVFSFLSNQIEFLTLKSNASNRTEKASFRLGLLEGFAEKLAGQTKLEETPHSDSAHLTQRALQNFKSDPILKNYLNALYPRLRIRKNASRLIDLSAFKSGHQEGRKLNLNKPIESSQNSGRFLNQPMQKK